MIKYNLICNCGKTFESWFSTSNEFDLLNKKKLIKCIYCDSHRVNKTVMAPSLNSKSNKDLKRSKLEKKIKSQLVNFRRYIEKNCKDVGDNFTREICESKDGLIDVKKYLHQLLLLTADEDFFMIGFNSISSQSFWSLQQKFN